MLITQLLSNFCIAILVCFITVMLFRSLLGRYLKNAFSDVASSLWVRYMVFLIYIVGVSIGTWIWEIEAYVGRPEMNNKFHGLTSDLMAMEMYKT